jgi:periplasmic protein CpxP/Spy
MKKSTLRTMLIVILLLGNAALITHIWTRKSGHRDGPRNEIIERLHFTPQQVRQYDILIADHQSDIRAVERRMMALKNKLYARLDQPINENTVIELSRVHQEIEHIHYAHFQALKKLCKPNQQGYFKALNRDIARLFSHRMKAPKK